MNLFDERINRQGRTYALVYGHFYSFFSVFSTFLFEPLRLLCHPSFTYSCKFSEKGMAYRVMTSWLCFTDGKRYERRMANDLPWLGTFAGRYSNCPQFWIISRKNNFLSPCFVYFMWLLVHPPQKIEIPHYIRYITDSFNHHMVKYHKTTHM